MITMIMIVKRESAEIVFETNGVNKKNKAEKLRGWHNN